MKTCVCGCTEFAYEDLVVIESTSVQENSFTRGIDGMYNVDFS